MSQVDPEQGVLLVSFAFPSGEIPAEVEVQITELTLAAQAVGAHVHARLVRTEKGEAQRLNLLNEDELRQAATCVEHMQASGLLDRGKEVKALSIGEPPQRFWDAKGFNGGNRSVLGFLAHMLHDGEYVETVPQLLSTGASSLRERSINKNGVEMLRRALIDSGMPLEFPWPYPPTPHLSGDEHLLRGVALLTPTFAELPRSTQKQLAHSFGVISLKDWDKGGRPTQTELTQCSVTYFERREQLLQIIAGDSPA